MTRYAPPPPKVRSVAIFVANLQRGGVTLHLMPDGRLLGRRVNRDGVAEDVPKVWQDAINARRDEIVAMFAETTPHPAPPSPTSRGGTPEPAGRIPASGS